MSQVKVDDPQPDERFPRQLTDLRYTARPSDNDLSCAMAINA